MRLCRACEDEFDVEREEEPAAPVGNGRDSDPPKLMPYRDALVQFVEVMFRNARKDGYVSFRVFRDNGRDERPVLIEAVRLDDQEFVPLMMIKAEHAANWYEPAVFAPPVCTFKNRLNAKTDNIHEAPALSTECDQFPDAAREKLEALLGPATTVVESGGEWIDETTGEIRAEGAFALAAEEARSHGRRAGHALRGAVAGRDAGRRRSQQRPSGASDALAWLVASQEFSRGWRRSSRSPRIPRSISQRRWRDCAKRSE